MAIITVAEIGETILNPYAKEDFLKLPMRLRAIHVTSHAETGIPIECKFVNNQLGSIDRVNMLISLPPLGSIESVKILQNLHRDGIKSIPKVSAGQRIAAATEDLQAQPFIVEMTMAGNSMGLFMDIQTACACERLLEEYLDVRSQKQVSQAFITCGLMWDAAQEKPERYIREIHSLCKLLQQRNGFFGTILAKHSDKGFEALGVMIDKVAFITRVLPLVIQQLSITNASWTQESAPSLPQVVKEQTPTPISAPPLWWEGDATTLIEEVLTGKPLMFQTEGALPVLADLPSATESKGRSGKGREGREPQPLDVLPQVVKSHFVVLPEPLYMAAVDARRSAAKRTIEEVIGKALGYHRRDTINLLPDQLGLVPSIVGGQYGQWRDRLARVRLLNPTVVVQATLKNPICYKVTVDGKVQTLTFTNTTPQMLAICPAGWLASPTQWWVAGLFGTPLDPTLLEFCETMPTQWWDKLDALNAKMAKAGFGSLDFDALLANRALAA